MPKEYKKKVIISGDVVEVYEYEQPRFRNYTQKKALSPPDEDRKYIDYETGEILTREEYKIKNRQRNSIRQRMTVMRLANTNFSEKNVRFLTLTFRENVKDTEQANQVFTRFIQLLNYQLKKKGNKSVQYLVTVEFQKRGAVHYHALVKMAFTRVEVIRECWRNAAKELGGNIDIKRVDRIDNVGAYICKYMSKNNEDLRLAGKKQYWTSRGLKKPIELVGEKADDYLRENALDKEKAAYVGEYEDLHTGGKVRYIQFNRKRNKNKLN